MALVKEQAVQRRILATSKQTCNNCEIRTDVAAAQEAGFLNVLLTNWTSTVVEHVLFLLLVFLRVTPTTDFHRVKLQEGCANY